MALDLYKRKRNFNKTAEPEGGTKKNNTSLAFVVQKHNASHLHYDFRLEMEGMLKSWAVPKGPSLNPDDKRLAMMVEDHPYDYKDFEGNIGEGNYGAGNVIVWDNGTYHPATNIDGKDEEKILLEELKKGHLSIVLEGKKLKGEFSLVKLKGRQENAWLLIKKKDEYASSTDILKNNKSVISDNTIESLDKQYPKEKKKSPATSKKPTVKKKSLT